MDATHDSDSVVVEQLPVQPVAMIRGTIPIMQLGEVMGERVPALLEYVGRDEVTPVGPFYALYYTFDDDYINGNTDVEHGIPVAAPVAGAGPVLAGELPGGEAISTVHDGPHEKLGLAYERLAAWLKEHGRAAAGPAWEVYYWIDPTRDVTPAEQDMQNWRVKLVQPI